MQTTAPAKHQWLRCSAHKAFLHSIKRHALAHCIQSAADCGQGQQQAGESVCHYVADLKVTGNPPPTEEELATQFHSTTIIKKLDVH